MTTMECLNEILNYLPVKVRESIRQMPDHQQMQIQEIRLRNQKPFGIVLNGCEQSGHQSIGFEELTRTFQAVCSYSVYSYEQELSEGYITIKGGCRVGICGSAVRNGNQVQSLRYISSLNFRIAGERIGIAEQLWNQSAGSLLITGTVGSGKTTYLRDICRIAGNQFRTALIDERGELAAVRRGMPSHDVGLMTDILDNYPRASGILTALRVLTPEYILCDEISTPEDVQAILQASGCGVRFAASCHAGSPEEFRSRPVIKPLLDAGIFKTCAFLHQGTVQSVRRLS